MEVEVELLEGRDKCQGCDGTRGVVEVPQASKASDSAHADATTADTVQTKLWRTTTSPQQPKGKTQRNTFQRNVEANTRVHDLNQKTMQALNTLAEENEAFEVTMKKVDTKRVTRCPQ